MAITFSTPIVCYLGDFLHSNKRNSSSYWVSNIYSEVNDFIGYRELIFDSDRILEKTYDSKNNKVSDAIIKNNAIDSNSVDIRIYFKDCEISKLYMVIDSDILECVTTQINNDILSFETLTASDGKKVNVNWGGIFSHEYWYCILKDSAHNEIGYREIHVDDDYSFIKTTFEKKGMSQYELLKKIDNKTITEHGSLERYIAYSRLTQHQDKFKVSKGGILLDSNLNIEYQRKIANELKR